MPSDQPTRRPLTVAIVALGGQGGGVLADWLVEVAEAHGWHVQSTSVPGVAQRTGSTVYYLELAPRRDDARVPIMALMPVPGDVDLVVGAELMEAGRAVARGLVTADRTTLVASSHRVYGITEKSAMGNGIADSNVVLETIKSQANRLLCFDMQAASEESGCVISAVLLGAIAASGTLPFPRGLYEKIIKDSGVAVRANLVGFEAGFSRGLVVAPSSTSVNSTAVPTTAAGRALEQRVRNTLPAHLYGLIIEAVRRLIDYQDAAYAAAYLDHLDTLLPFEAQAGPAHANAELLSTVARQLALAMSYEDTIRVAQVKTRTSRLPRVREEVRAGTGQLVYTTDYVHPRLQEVADSLPAPLGRRLLASPLAQRALAPLFRRGRHVRTGTITGFLLFHGIASLRRWRRITLRHHIEAQHIEEWLQRVRATALRDYPLAIEIAECRQLVKGYSDTHERGQRNFATLMRVADAHADRADLAGLLKALRLAALADEEGTQLSRKLEELGVAASAKKV